MNKLTVAITKEQLEEFDNAFRLCVLTLGRGKPCTDWLQVKINSLDDNYIHLLIIVNGKTVHKLGILQSEITQFIKFYDYSNAPTRKDFTDWGGKIYAYNSEGLQESILSLI